MFSILFPPVLTNKSQQYFALLRSIKAILAFCKQFKCCHQYIRNNCIMTSLLSTSPTSREQAIERYTALVKKRRDIARKNLMIQTKISQYLRKNKIDLTSTQCSLENMTAEDEKKEYEKLLKVLRGITGDQAEETTEFVDAVSIIESQKNKIESKINHTEEDLQEIKTKIFKSARNSQTNLPIHPDVI